jgi:hypothetical protein
MDTAGNIAPRNGSAKFNIHPENFVVAGFCTSNVGPGAGTYLGEHAVVTLAIDSEPGTELALSVDEETVQLSSSFNK